MPIGQLCNPRNVSLYSKFYFSGAGISVSAGVGQAARGAVGFSDLTTDAKPSGDGKSGRQNHEFGD